MQQRSRERHLLESEDEIQLRQQTNAARSRESRQRNQEAQTTLRHQYLHQEGWTDPQRQLHQQPWVMNSMSSFHNKQTKWKQKLCTVCHEVWPTRGNHRESVDLNNSHICTRCKCDKGEPKRYLQLNDMDPHTVPECLQNLTQIEEMLIARVCPVMCIYRKHGGQRGYKGHVINFPQNVKEFITKLPSSVSRLPILVVR